jgi:hypothetical protein
MNSPQRFTTGPTHAWTTEKAPSDGLVKAGVPAHSVASPEKATLDADLQVFCMPTPGSNREPLHYERTTSEGRAGTHGRRGHVHAGN